MVSKFIPDTIIIELLTSMYRDATVEWNIETYNVIIGRLSYLLDGLKENRKRENS